MNRHRVRSSTDDQRQAIVWDTIERIAFRPVERRNWLGVYSRSLHQLWETEPSWQPLDATDQFSLPLPNLTCEYALESFGKYGTTIVEGDRKLLVMHVDPSYRSKASLHSAPGKYPHQQKDSSLRNDVEKVLDGMIFHPRAHSHLKDLWSPLTNGNDSGLLKLNEIRLGMGIENSYVFLFHLRYQFCLVSEDVRNAERERLISLFQSAIALNSSMVSSKELFDWGK